MNRKFLDIMAIFTLLMYIELNHLNLIVELDMMTVYLAKISILTLFLPVLSVFVRVIDLGSKNSINNAIVISVSKNQLNGYRISDDLRYISKCNFSTEQHFIANEKALEECLNTVIKELVKGRGVLIPSPYVVVKVDLNKISEMEKDSLINNTIRAGAIKAIVMDNFSNDSEIRESLRANPIENIA